MYNLYYHRINPIMLQIGPVSLYWYGMMYVLSFLFAMWFLSYYSRYYQGIIFWKKKEIEYLLFLNILGVVLGGRVGYFFIYQWDYCFQSFLQVFNIWDGGMSFHGGLIGVIVSIIFFSYKERRPFFQVSDFIVPVVPLGLGLGRLGNFINGELWGRVAIDIPWAMLFPRSLYQDLILLEQYPQWKVLFDYYGRLPRHPSQLYEMLLEGVFLFIIVNIFTLKSRPIGSISGLFLICYGVLRAIAECFREPDCQIGYIGNFFTLGQIFSLPMIVFGIVIMLCCYRKQ